MIGHLHLVFLKYSIIGEFNGDGCEDHIALIRHAWRAWFGKRYRLHLAKRISRITHDCLYTTYVYLLNWINVWKYFLQLVFFNLPHLPKPKHILRQLFWESRLISPNASFGSAQKRDISIQKSLKMKELNSSDMEHCMHPCISINRHPQSYRIDGLTDRKNKEHNSVTETNQSNRSSSNKVQIPH